MILQDTQPGTPGVGVLFNPALDAFVRDRDCLASLDYLAVIPDRSWIDNGRGSASRFEDLPDVARVLEGAAKSVPLVMHCIGLSICSADVFDEEYLAQLARWRSRHDCPWISEHLSFSRSGSGHETNAAFALPVPYDREILDLLIPRVGVAQRSLGCPFLLENNVYYFTYAEQEMSEAEFLNELTSNTDCYLLLDLHNVYTNAVNHKFDATEFLSSLDLTRVVEVHVAGGDSMMDFHVDSHAGPTLEGVWDLLRFVAPRAPALRGVTFEFHEASWPKLRNEGILEQLERARGILADNAVADA